MKLLLEEKISLRELRIIFSLISNWSQLLIRKISIQNKTPTSG